MTGLIYTLEPQCLLHPVYCVLSTTCVATLSTAYCLLLMLVAGVTGLPARRPVEVPPSSWIEDMRTPAADLILMEFHRQKYSTEGEADGQENTSPNSAFHTDPAPQPNSPISGLLLALCFCPSACDCTSASSFRQKLYALHSMTCSYVQTDFNRASL